MEFEDFEELLPGMEMKNLGDSCISKDNIYIVPAMDSEKDFMKHFKDCAYVMGYVREFKNSLRKFTHLKADFDDFDRRNSEIERYIPMIRGNIEALVDDPNYEQLKKELSGEKVSKINRSMKKGISRVCAEFETFNEFNYDFDTLYEKYKKSFNETIWPKRRKKMIIAGAVIGTFFAYGALCLFGIPYKVTHGIGDGFKSAYAKIEQRIDEDPKLAWLKKKEILEVQHYPGLRGDEIIEDASDDGSDEISMREDLKRLILSEGGDSGY